MIDELRDLYRGVAVHATEDDEHEAALELLLLMMLADRRLSLDEQDEIESFAADHAWESDTFSMQNRLGPATAKVRAAISSPEATDALLQSIDERIASTVLRAELVGASRQIADADGSRSNTEDRILARVIAHFG
jgi:uncharacterized tellurite resistance protein B-like protein